MQKPFVVISGLPGSGKTSLGRRLAPALELPLIDKDDILERLFESEGIGDAAWRRQLSRESDVILQRQATLSTGAVLVSFWHLAGMRPDSGTPTDWLQTAPNLSVNVHCVCDLEVAAQRFLERRRHPGHLDGQSSRAEVLASFQALSLCEPLDIASRIEVDTSREPGLDDLVHKVRMAFGHT
jgi:hypothetical protein